MSYLDVLRYAMKTRDESYMSEMKYLFYLVLEEVRSQLNMLSKRGKDLKMISFRMDI
ncbi:MAG: hypothetical protein ACLRI8_10105 [Agathobacter rectalis]